MKLLSRSEELVILAVWHLQRDAYGASIRSYLTSIRSYLTGETETNWSIASVYTPLDRLAKRQLVSSHVGAPTPERGGRSKKMYCLTSMGVKALQDVRALNERLWTGLRSLVMN